MLYICITSPLSSSSKATCMGNVTTWWQFGREIKEGQETAILLSSVSMMISLIFVKQLQYSNCLSCFSLLLNLGEYFTQGCWGDTKSPRKDSNMYYQLFIKNLLEQNRIWETNRSSLSCWLCCLGDYCWNINSTSGQCLKLSSCSEKQITYNTQKATGRTGHLWKVTCHFIESDVLGFRCKFHIQSRTAAAQPRHNLLRSSSSTIPTCRKTKTRAERKMVHTRSKSLMLSPAKKARLKWQICKFKVCPHFICCITMQNSNSYEHAFLYEPKTLTQSHRTFS